MKKIVAVMVMVMVMVFVCCSANAETNSIINDADLQKVVINDVVYQNVIDLLFSENEDGTVNVTVVTVDRCFVHEAINWADCYIWQGALVPAWQWVAQAGSDAWSWTTQAATDAWNWVSGTATDAWAFVTSIF